MAKSATIHQVLLPSSIYCSSRANLAIRTARDFERFLRSHGFSNRAAKTICTRGFTSFLGEQGENADEMMRLVREIHAAIQPSVVS